MNMTRKRVMSVQTTLMAILLWPTVSITSVSVGCLGSFTVTSLAVPVVAPVGSGAADAGAGAAAGAAAAGAGAGAGVGAGCGAAGGWPRALTACVVISVATASVTPIANAILQKRPARLLIPVPSHGCLVPDT